MASASSVRVRVFKSAWFAKAARKARLSEAELCKAIVQARAGQADDLGGGVFKKRLGGNRYRSIILARAGRHWFYEYLFAKQDRPNIDEDELFAFRKLAKGYAALTADQLSLLIGEGDLVEICNDGQG